MIRPTISILIAVCIGVSAGCSAIQPKSMTDKEVQTIEKSTNINNSLTTISVEEAEKAVEDLCRKPDIDVQAFHYEKYDTEIDGVRYYYFDVLYGLAMAKSPKLGDDEIYKVFVSSKDKSIYEVIGNETNGNIGRKLIRESL